jgi:hypothetical protein
MKAYGRANLYIHIFVTSALVRGEWSASWPSRFTPGTLWVDPRAGMDDAEKKKFLTLPGLELRPLGRPASRYTDCANLSPIIVRF